MAERKRLRNRLIPGVYRRTVEEQAAADTEVAPVSELPGDNVLGVVIVDSVDRPPAGTVPAVSDETDETVVVEPEPTNPNAEGEAITDPSHPADVAPELQPDPKDVHADKQRADLLKADRENQDEFDAAQERADAAEKERAESEDDGEREPTKDELQAIAADEARRHEVERAADDPPEE